MSEENTFSEDLIRYKDQITEILNASPSPSKRIEIINKYYSVHLTYNWDNIDDLTNSITKYEIKIYRSINDELYRRITQKNYEVTPKQLIEVIEVARSFKKAKWIISDKDMDNSFTMLQIRIIAIYIRISADKDLSKTELIQGNEFETLTNTIRNWDRNLKQQEKTIDDLGSFEYDIQNPELWDVIGERIGLPNDIECDFFKMVSHPKVWIDRIESIAPKIVSSRERTTDSRKDKAITANEYLLEYISRIMMFSQSSAGIYKYIENDKEKTAIVRINEEGNSEIEFEEIEQSIQCDYYSSIFAYLKFIDTIFNKNFTSQCLKEIKKETQKFFNKFKRVDVKEISKIYRDAFNSFRELCSKYNISSEEEFDEILNEWMHCQQMRQSLYTDNRFMEKGITKRDNGKRKIISANPIKSIAEAFEIELLAQNKQGRRVLLIYKDKDNCPTVTLFVDNNGNRYLIDKEENEVYKIEYRTIGSQLDTRKGDKDFNRLLLRIAEFCHNLQQMQQGLDNSEDIQSL